MRYPSVKTIGERLNLEPVKAKAVRALIEGSADPKCYESVSGWIRQCYHEPRDDEQVMEAVNEVMGGFGIEAIRGRHVDNYYYDIQAVYVNMGDTYAGTVLLDHETGRYEVTTMGDWVESKGDEREVE